MKKELTTLFDPTTIGSTHLSNRIIMAPLTRNRASLSGVLPQITAQYYGQRATAGLMISEATAVSKQGSGYPKIPGIWTEEQKKSWKNVISEVHEKKGKIFIQLYHTGRIAHSSIIGETPVSASDITINGEVTTSKLRRAPFERPRALEKREIPGIVQNFALAAKSAIQAGADGVEIHAANGYLIDQFLRDSTNNRTDEYGGNPQNRARFLTEIAHAVSEEVGADKVGVRLSPENAFNSMSDSNPQDTFTAAAKALNRVGVAYLHLIESFSGEVLGARPKNKISKSMREVFTGHLILNRGYTLESGNFMVQSGFASAISFGTPFISNPDFVERLRNGIPLSPADRSKFYDGYEDGYIDYPTFEEQQNCLQKV
jgi:N-ethylmaleimide reductase